MSEILRSASAVRVRIPLNAPVAVMIAGTAIIATRCIGLIMLSNNLGVAGLQSFIETSSRSWDLTLLFLASLAILFMELRCGFGVMRGQPWARWCYVGCQFAGAGYLFVATWRGFYPEMFALSGDNAAEIFGQLLLHKSPDMVVAALLFLPPASQRFFNRGR